MYRNTNCKLQAHRGVSSDAPGNTMPAYELAVKEGYDIIELDPKYTKDNVFVLIHNRTINATARKDGKAPEEDIYVKDLTLAELLEYDFGEFFSPEFKGTKIPTMEEVLQFSERTGMPLKIDNVVQSFPEEQQEMFFALLASHPNAPLGITGDDLPYLEKAVKAVPGITVHYDGPITDDCFEPLLKLAGSREKLYIWQRLDIPYTSWCKVPPATPESAAQIKKYAYLGIWALAKEEEMNIALSLGADVVETNGELKP